MFLAERAPALARDARAARAVGFWWGYAEGVAFFIVPDVYVSFAALFSLRTGAIAWLASIGGSLAGVVTLYAIGAAVGPAILALVDKVPGIPAGMFIPVQSQLARGLPYTPFLVLGGVPLKVYAAVAFVHSIPLGSLLVWTVFARIVRIAPTYIIAAAVRLAFRRWIDARPMPWLILLVSMWILFYTWYFIVMTRAVWF